MMKKAIQAIVKIIQIIFKIVMFIVSNPLVSLIILIITLAIFFLIWWLSDKQDVNRVSHTSPPAIVLNKDEVQAL